MKDWFDTLDSRERIFVLSGAVVVVIVLLYAFVWTPLDKGHKTLEASVAAWERSLEELRPLKGMQHSSGAAKQTANVNTQQTPVVIVDQTLRARGLDRSLKRSQPTTSNGIRVEFENVAFDDLVLWLGDLSSQYAMHVSSGSMSTANRAGPGRINATLTLERTL
ncbi:MAG: type II secretion system protein M [Gammaproteobacteria bacterium]|jgi:general secretion pathway protein M|nr:type II secretion system protein M [Gammaproteobacteria bacterium]MDH3750738.1 type II secretion system protein M [Gammaproteobacteria bacterium]